MHVEHFEDDIYNCINFYHTRHICFRTKAQERWMAQQNNKKRKLWFLWERIEEKNIIKIICFHYINIYISWGIFFSGCTIIPNARNDWKT